MVGGYSEDDNEPLYIGRALHKGHLIPGKVQPTHKCCYIPYKNQEIAKVTYEILVDPNTDSRCIREGTTAVSPRLDHDSDDESLQDDDVDDSDNGNENDDGDDYEDRFEYNMYGAENNSDGDY